MVELTVEVTVEGGRGQGRWQWSVGGGVQTPGAVSTARLWRRQRERDRQDRRREMSRSRARELRYSSEADPLDHHHRPAPSSPITTTSLPCAPLHHSGRRPSHHCSLGGVREESDARLRCCTGALGWAAARRPPHDVRSHRRPAERRTHSPACTCTTTIISLKLFTIPHPASRCCREEVVPCAVLSVVVRDCGAVRLSRGLRPARPVQPHRSSQGQALTDRQRE